MPPIEILELLGNMCISQKEETKLLYKGIFWYVPQEDRLLVKKVACRRSGEALEKTDYSSKSGENFNHKVEWDSFLHKLTKGKPYNYYPRGRVEIKNEKVIIYLHPLLNQRHIVQLIKKEFALKNANIKMRIIADESSHYECAVDICGLKIDNK